MTFTVTIDRDEDGTWVAKCPVVPGSLGHGKTKAEALENVKAAIKICLDIRIERGLPPTLDTQEVEVEGVSIPRFSREEWLAALRQARGIWKDRDDLPDFDEMRGRRGRLHDA